jgi:hypothetical protein
LSNYSQAYSKTLLDRFVEFRKFETNNPTNKKPASQEGNFDKAPFASVHVTAEVPDILNPLLQVTS